MQRIETRISSMESKIDALSNVVNKNQPVSSYAPAPPPSYNVVASLFQPPPANSLPTSSAPVVPTVLPSQDTSRDEALARKLQQEESAMASRTRLLVNHFHDNPC